MLSPQSGFDPSSLQKPNLFDNAVGSQGILHSDESATADRNLIKYLSPVKHLYRVAYQDPSEHIKRV